MSVTVMWHRRRVCNQRDASILHFRAVPARSSPHSRFTHVCHDYMAQALRLQPAGRTDSGVHAAGQVVSFHLPCSCRMSEGELLKGLNARCPTSLRILQVARVPQDFSARHTAIGKLYRYRYRIVLPLHLTAIVPLSFGSCKSPGYLRTSALALQP